MNVLGLTGCEADDSLEDSKALKKLLYSVLGGARGIDLPTSIRPSTLPPPPTHAWTGSI